MTDPYTNLDAEGAVLGALLYKPTLIEDARAIVTEQIFYRDQNRLVWRALEALGEQADIITVARKIETWGKADEVDQTYLVRLENDSPVAESWRYHADILRDLASRRVIELTLRMGIRALHGEESPELVVEHIREALQQAIERREESGAIAQDVSSVLDRLDSFRDSHAVPGIPYQFPVLDDELGGQHPGQLIVVAGATGSGKSTFLGNQAENAATRGVAVIASNEMLGVDYATRFLARRAHVSQAKFLTANVSDRDWQAIGAAAGYVGDLKIYRMESAFSVDRLRVAIARARADMGPVVWAGFDWIQAIESSAGRWSNRTQELDAAIRALKHIAVEERIPIMVGAQFHRTKDGEEPTLDSIRDSNMISTMSDNTLFIQPWPKDEVKPAARGKVPKIIRIHKSRQGGRAVQPVWFDGACAEFVPIIAEPQTGLPGLNGNGGRSKV